MVAVDFTAAFDRAKRDLLYAKMLDKGFPPAAVRWVRAFLTRRRFRVRCGDMLSAMREAEEGFPQGTVLGPLLWNIFCDDIVAALKRGLPEASVEVVVYADDVTVLLRGEQLPELYKRAQAALDRLSAWEVANRATVSLEKTTVTVFTPRPCAIPPRERPRLWYADQSLPPPFRGTRKTLEYATQPKLLGLLYDERLTFRPHVQQLRPKLQKRAKTVSALNGTTWGCDHRTLRALHMSYVQSKSDYGLAAYGPYASQTALEPLERELQQQACKLAGCAPSTRRAVALLEAGLASVDQRVDYCTAVQYERSLRLPDGNRARAAAAAPGPGNPKRGSGRTRARRVLAAAGLADAE
eukprot:gene19662-biopygen30151